ncbi:hypothetical protein PARA125_001117 [Parachlamydia sp. AcF125]|nr:hypothetical protein [Parachlamydia sp. AcF125]
MELFLADKGLLKGGRAFIVPVLLALIFSKRSVCLLLKLSKIWSFMLNQSLPVAEHLW